MRRVLALALLASAASLWSQTTVRFQNWEFQSPEGMEKAQETPSALVYRLPASLGRSFGQATLTFHAPERFTGALSAWFDAEWQRLTAGKKVESVLDTEEIENIDGVKGLAREAQLAGGGLIHATAWNPEGAVDLMVLETTTAIATAMGAAAHDLLVSTLVVYPLEAGPSAVASSGGGSGAGSAGGGSAAGGAPGPGAPGGGPTPLGPDPYGSIDWDGPDVTVRSLFDMRVVDVEEDLKELLRLNRGLIGSVPPAPVDFATALSRARGLLKVADRDALIANLGKEKALSTPQGAVATASALLASGREGDGLAVLLAAQQRWPRDANALQALASVLLYLGQANEALAILDELDRRGALADAPWGIAPRSMLDYCRGYALILLGRLGEARSLIAPIVDREPNLSEAALAMALIEAAAGGEPRAAFVKGSWRHREDRMDHEVSEEWPKDPSKDAESVALDATGYLDLSHGTPGELPYVPGLVSFDLAPEYAKWVPKTRDEAVHKAEGLIKERDSKLERWRRITPDGPQKARMEELVSIFDEANATLPAIRVLMRERDRAYKELDAITDVSSEELDRAARRPDFVDCEVRLALSRRILARHRPYVDALEQSIRRLYKVLHRYQTGIAAYVGDPLLREVLDLDVKIDGLLTYAEIVGAHLDLYAMAPAVECPPPPPPMKPGGDVSTGDLAACSDEAARHSVSMDAEVIGVELNCREVSVEVKAVLLVGVSAELSINTKGEMTLFAGAKGDIKVASAKTGFYTTFDSDGINDIGYKTQVKASAGLGLQYNYLVGEKTAFSLAPGPSAPRPGGLREYRRP